MCGLVTLAACFRSEAILLPKRRHINSNAIDMDAAAQASRKHAAICGLRRVASTHRGSVVVVRVLRDAAPYALDQQGRRRVLRRLGENSTRKHRRRRRAATRLVGCTATHPNSLFPIVRAHWIKGQ